LQIGQSHPTGLTTNLLKLFEPRPPLEHKPPLEKRKLPAYSGKIIRAATLQFLYAIGASFHGRRC
jgi:hypothetical protein